MRTRDLLATSVAFGLCTLACGCSQSTYGDADHGKDPIPHEDGPGDTTAPGGGASTPSTGAATTTTTTGAPPAAFPIPPGGTIVLEENFDNASPSFTLFKDLSTMKDIGTMTIIQTPDGGGVARICADSAGQATLGDSIGPIRAGTYEFSALLRPDPTTPATKWILNATSYTPTPNTLGTDGMLVAGATRAVTTTKVGDAFTTTFSVSLGIGPLKCMLVDEIRVVYTPP